MKWEVTVSYTQNWSKQWFHCSILVSIASFWHIIDKDLALNCSVPRPLRAVLHDGFKLDVPVTALPAGDEVEHMRALGRLPVLSALGAGEGDAQGGEHGEVGGLVPHSQQPGEEIDLACDGGDGQEAGGAHDEQGEYCLVGEGGVDVGGLLQPPG